MKHKKDFEANLTSTLYPLIDCQRLTSTFSFNMSVFKCITANEN